MEGEAGSDKRRDPRHPNPYKGTFPPVITMDMPGLAGFPLSPEDFSEGGFKTLVPVPLEAGAVFPCAVHVRGSTILGFMARVAWVREVQGLPPMWEVGFSLEISDLEREELWRLLSAATGRSRSES